MEKQNDQMIKILCMQMSKSLHDRITRPSAFKTCYQSTQTKRRTELGTGPETLEVSNSCITTAFSLITHVIFLKVVVYNGVISKGFVNLMGLSFENLSLTYLQEISSEISKMVPKSFEKQ